MVEIKSSVGYMQSDGKMTVDTLVKNTELSSLVIAFDFYSTDVPRRYLGTVSSCIQPFGTSGCINVRAVGIPFKDPYFVQIRRCISGPNCAANSCGTFSGIVDSSFTGEVVRYDGVIPSEATYTVPSDCAPPPTGLNITNVTAELSTASGFPGTQGWTRINVTATGSGMLSISVDNVQLLTDGPLNFGPTPFTVTYLQQLAVGTRNICVQAIGGNKVCAIFVVPGAAVFTLTTDRTTMVAGQSAIFSGLYKPYTTINIFIEGVVRTHLVQVNTDAFGTYSGVATIDTIGTLQIGACTAGGLYIYECSILPDKSNYVTINVTSVPPPVTFTLTVDKTSITSGDKVAFFGGYKANTSINIYWQTVLAGVAVPYKNHLTTITTGSNGQYLTTIPIGITVSGTVRFGACNPGGLGLECGADLSNTVDVQVSYVPPPPPTPFILKVDKTTIIHGDIVTFSGKYKPNSLINIFIEGTIRAHLAQLTTDANGNYSTSLQITTEGTLQIGACAAGGLYIYECAILPDKSNYITLTVNPIPTVPLTMTVDKTTVSSGEKITFSGSYKPNRTINIYYKSVYTAYLPKLFATANSDSVGKYSTVATIEVTIPGTVTFGACIPSLVYGVPCEIGGDYSNTIDVEVKYYPAVPFILKIDGGTSKSITSGDQVTFSGSYKPNVDINIYYQDTIKHSIVKTTIANNGTFSVTARPASDTKVTLTIGACETGAITECAIGVDTSNTVTLVITPIVVPPPPPGIRYKCSGAPDYQCVETTQTGTSTFATKADCITKCKAGVVCKEGEISIFGQCVSNTTLAVGAIVVVGVIVLASRKEE